MPSFRAVSKLTLREHALWTIKFHDAKPLNTLGTVCAATNVTFNGANPLVKELEVGPGIPIRIWYGVTPPSEINITFVENDKLEVQSFLEKYIRGETDGNGDALLARTAIPLGEMEQHCLKLEIEQFNEKLEKVNSYTFLVIPKDSLAHTLEGAVDTAQVFQVAFNVVGEIRAK